MRINTLSGFSVINPGISLIFENFGYDIKSSSIFSLIIDNGKFIADTTNNFMRIDPFRDFFYINTLNLIECYLSVSF